MKKQQDAWEEMANDPCNVNAERFRPGSKIRLPWILQWLIQ